MIDKVDFYVYTKSTYIRKVGNKVDKHSFSRETTISIRNLKQLSSEFGLPYIENINSLTVVGYEHLLIFSKQEDTQCRLIEIY